MSDNEIKRFGGQLEIKSEAAGEVSAVVATLGVVDKDGDVLLPGSFPPSSKVKMSGYGHDVITEGKSPVGKGTIIVEGDKAIFSGKFFMSTMRGADAFHTVKELGTDGEWSFGFPRNVKTAPMTDDWRSKGAKRLIAGLSPIEASPVFVGAGVNTGTLYTKTEDAADPFEEHRGEVAKRAAEIRRWELREIEQNARAQAKTDVNNEAEDLFNRLKSRAFDARPTGEESLLVYKLHSHCCAWWGIPEEQRPRVRWFYKNEKRIGLYDEKSNEIFLAVELPRDQLIITYRHELEHSRQFFKGWMFNEGGAEKAGEILLERVKEGRVDGVAA